MSRKVHPDGRIQLDHIEHGSAEHANHIGIRPAKKGDAPVCQGYCLIDPHPFGSMGWTLEARTEFLRQKVSGFMVRPEPVQSDDPAKPHYHPPMWMPYDPERDSPTRGIV